MKSAWIAALALLIAACKGNTQEQVHLRTQKDSVSYSIGMDIARTLNAQDIDVDPEAIAGGLRDALSGTATLLTQEQAQKVIMEFQERMMQQHEQRTEELGMKHKLEGEAFLADNKKEKDVVTLPSGLQYKVITMGTGKKPLAHETVRVHYRGTFIDGREFDSSHGRGEPAIFPVNGVIAGWTEALQLMPVGSKWMLFIPSNLAYGERGAGQVIPPHTTLIFEVELLSIQ